MPDLREVRRSRRANALGAIALAVLEAAPTATRARIRARLWAHRAYLVVVPGRALVRRALSGFPARVRATCEGAPFFRFDARGGGGYWGDEDEIWLAAGVETYESLRQAALSARHELFHYVSRHDPAYRADEDRGFASLLAALRASAGSARGTRFGAWLRGSFLPQGDHANVVELFADVPTNFRDLADLPPPLARHFAPLVAEADGGPDPRAPEPGPELRSLAGFQSLLREVAG